MGSVDGLGSLKGDINNMFMIVAGSITYMCESCTTVSITNTGVAAAILINTSFLLLVPAELPPLFSLLV